MSIEDYVTVNEGKDSVTLTATIDPKEVEKAGKSIHYVATHLVNDIYDNSTSTGICDWLLGNEYNTHEVKSEPGKGIVQTGQIKYNSFIDGILRPAEKTTYTIAVNEADGTVNVTFTNEGHGDYAKRAAEDALGAMRNYHSYFVSYKAEKKETPKEEKKKEAKKDETLEDKVGGDKKGMPAEDSPEVEQEYQNFQANFPKIKTQYDQLSQIKDKKTFYEKLVMPQYEGAIKAAEAQKAAAEAQATKVDRAENPKDIVRSEQKEEKKDDKVKVVLPRNLEDELRSYTQRDNEVCGRAFARRQGNNLVIDDYIMTGEGTAGTVKDSDAGINEVTEYLRLHPDKTMITFHTHSEGTRKLGTQYMYDFSSIDEPNMKADPNNVYMLVTPEVVKARMGKDEVDVAVA